MNIFMLLKFISLQPLNFLLRQLLRQTEYLIQKLFKKEWANGYMYRVYGYMYNMYSVSISKN